MRIESWWYQERLHPLLAPLLPFSWLYGGITGIRRWLYRSGIKQVRQFSVPVVVIGNITVGGTGKTPLTAWLANQFREHGFKPGIAMRGVGGQGHNQAMLVKPESNPFEMGDEAVLLAQNAGCPVAVCLDRPKAVEILSEAGCNLILTDDGLQHYRLARKLEIAVIDGSRYFGNGQLLPAGPLRESPRRLNEVDFVVINESGERSAPALNIKAPVFSMRLLPQKLIALKDGGTKDLSQFHGQSVHAVAGIGNPQRFFDFLSQQGLSVLPHVFPDHHAFSAADLNFGDQKPILMTEKDAIKCKRLSQEPGNLAKQWFMPVKAELSSTFLDKVIRGLSL